MSANGVQTIKLADYQPPDFKVESHSLKFSLFDSCCIVTHKQRFVRCKEGAKLQLNGVELNVLQIALDGKELEPGEYTYEDNLLTIENVPDAFLLQTIVAVQPDLNKELSGLYRSNGVYCTQCEAEGFRRISFTLDRPDVLATYRVRIEADKKTCPVLLSNGNLEKEGDVPSSSAAKPTRHFVEWFDPHPKPCYLFALVAGDLAHVQRHIKTPHGHDVDLYIYTEPAFVKQTEFAMESLVNAIKWDETRFNLDYDLGRFNIVAVSDFNMGAMENKSLNIFNTKYILGDTETATDPDFHGIEGVIGHEYFHNWTGNRITCRDWFQLSLKEGLTVFRDQEFSGDMGTPALERIKNVNVLRQIQFAEDASPLSHPVQPQEYAAIDNFYTSTVYQKGAEVIRMYHTIIGEEVFQKGMKLYVERHDGQAVRIEDFAKCMEDASGFPFSEHFFQWYTTKGTPHLTFSSRYDAGEKKLYLTAKQDVSKVTPQRPLLVPVKFSLLNKEGEHYLFDGTEKEKLWTVGGEEETFVVEGVEEGWLPVWMHGFTAPVYYDYPYTDEELAHIAFFSSDTFARYEALQIYYRRLFLHAMSSEEESTYKEGVERFVKLLISMLNHKERGDGEKALLLRLPSVAAVMNGLTPPLDMDAVLDADRRIAQDVAHGLAPEAARFLKEDRRETSPAYSIQDAHIRQLRGILMHHLAVTQADDTRELFASSYKEAKNMTEQMSALVALNQKEDAFRVDALEDFAAKFAEYPLVMDKWFALQSQAKYDGALEMMKRLAEDERFVPTNPNRFRSFVGAFSQNLQLFHAKDGSGYEFVISQIKRILTLNAHLAARVLNVFAIAPRLDAHRQQQIAEALKPLRDVEGVSVDVLEVIERILSGIHK